MKPGKKIFFVIFIVIVLVGGVLLLFRHLRQNEINDRMAMYTGSESCKPCHERFYDLWADSHHGLAMQPVTAGFVEDNIQSFNERVKIGNEFFEVSFSNDTLFFNEILPSGENEKYPAVHVMGGKYIYYFLTPLSGGRLQVLPLAYDCDTDSWYNNPESGVRHFENIEDAPLNWKNHLYTFNTTCYNCHVSQLKTNYNLKTNTYNTTWREPGINCETCHGPSREHIEVCVKAGEGSIPDDLKIVQTSEYTPEQHNAACGSCHAKASVIAESFSPGAKFYDHFDLVTLENPDFYADGRDLGENYTMTTWEMNKCVDKSNLHCVTCHTSSGRNRFAGEKANEACMPCHSDKVNNVSAHSFHEEDSEGSKCVSCHMPKTVFARMDRSDHSFRPPMPEATIAFGSPNACNICHFDKSPEWAAKEISKTHRREYQQETIQNGLLIRKAREADWSELDEILNGLSSGRFDEVFATSFIRLLENCNDARKWPVLIEMTMHESPLVRGAAAHSLYMSNSRKSFDRLMELLDDELRLVRLNAAYALSSFPPRFIDDSNRERISDALKEYEKSLVVRPDSWSAYYNLGNYYTSLNAPEKALDAYEISINIYPEALMSMVNAGYVYSLQRKYKEAEELFLRALSFEPGHEAALLNIALLYGETGQAGKAIDYFRRLLDVDPGNSIAAYNLAILVSSNDIDEAVTLSRIAMQNSPGNPKYAYTHAFYVNSAGDRENAKRILANTISANPGFLDSYLLLAAILQDQGQYAKAISLLKDAMEKEYFNNEQKQVLSGRIKELGKNDNK